MNLTAGEHMQVVLGCWDRVAFCERFMDFALELMDRQPAQQITIASSWIRWRCEAYRAARKLELANARYWQAQL